MSRVKLNEFSVFLSILYFINMVLGPLKVYLTEIPVFLPPTFRHPNIFPDLNLPPEKMVLKLHDIYNNTKSYQSYEYDSIHNVDILRTIIPRENKIKIESIGGAPYFPKDLIELLKNHTNVARSWRLHFWFIPTIVCAAWIHSNDEISEIYFIFILDHQTIYWRLWKFFFRFFLCCIIFRIGLKEYYTYIKELKISLKKYSLRIPTEAKNYIIIIGDPMCILLSNRFLCFANIIEGILSAEYTGQACLRVAWTDNFLTFLIGVLYLGNVVWFAYGTLVLLNLILKFIKKTHWFEEANSTILALVSYFFGGICTYFQSIIPYLLNFYFYLFNLYPTFNKNGIIDKLDTFTPWFFFVIIMAMIPFFLAFFLSFMIQFIRICQGSQKIIHRISTHTSIRTSLRNTSISGPSSKNVIYPASIAYQNDSLNVSNISFKMQRIDFSLIFIKWIYFYNMNINGILYGGTIYHLFHLNSSYKSDSTLGQSASDCFVLGYNVENKLIEITRISLIRQLDLKNIKKLPKSDTNCAVSKLIIKENVSRQSITAIISPSNIESKWIA